MIDIPLWLFWVWVALSIIGAALVAYAIAFCIAVLKNGPFA